MITRLRILPVLPTLLAVLVAPAQTASALDVDVSVAGRIKPLSPICNVNLPQKLDYGVIPLRSINADRITMLDKKNFAVQVQCSEASKFTMQFVDAKRDTVVDDESFLDEVRLAQARPISQDESFGLGKDGTGQKIGAMFMQIKWAFYSVSDLIFSGDPVYQKGGDWMFAGRVYRQFKYSVAALGGKEPALMNDATVTVELIPVLDSARLDLTEKIEMGGQLTLEISQL